MGYVVVACVVINVVALGLIALFFWGIAQDYPRMVQSAIEDEVRRQDDRIEKRVARAADTHGTDPDAIGTVPTDGLRAGMPYRR